MKMMTTTIAITATLTLAPAVLAQATAPGAATAPAASGSSFSDDDLKKFASAAIELNKIQSDTSVAQADKQPKMVAAVQASGLDPQKFNTIAKAAQTDTALQQKIQAAVAAAQTPQQPPASQPPQQ